MVAVCPNVVHQVARHLTRSPTTIQSCIASVIQSRFAVHTQPHPTARRNLHQIPAAAAALELRPASQNRTPWLTWSRANREAVTACSSYRPSLRFPGAPHHQKRSMASDDDYLAFLNKAAENPSAGVRTETGATATGQRPFRATEQGVAIPQPLVRVTQGAVYTTDADEPFEPVALRWDEAGKGLPDEEEFAGLIGHWAPSEAEIGIMDPVDWDGSGQYKDITDAVREAGAGNDVRVYRVARGGTRVEYWVVTTEGKGKEAKLVGVKALAVES